MTTEYRKTPDPNIFIRADTSETLIHLDELTSGIDDLQAQIDAVPKPKTLPDQETLDMYNEHIDMISDPSLETKLRDKQDLVALLKSLKAMEL